MRGALKRYRETGRPILLDSGNYEATRREDPDWSPERLHVALRTTPHDWAFCYDKINPPDNPDAMRKAVVRAVKRDAEHTSKPILPIVHAPRGKNGEYNVQHIPTVMRQIAEELKPLLLAIPERELGAGIIERAKTIHRIRQELRQLGFYQPLHILGTGNPLSVAILSAVGADSFDGLEWCRVVADADKHLLYHFQQYDFFAYQTALAKSQIVRDVIGSDDISYAGKVVFHNMEFFTQFMIDLRSAASEAKLIRFLSERLPHGSMEQLERALPGVF